MYTYVYIEDDCIIEMVSNIHHYCAQVYLIYIYLFSFIYKINP